MMAKTLFDPAARTPQIKQTSAHRPQHRVWVSLRSTWVCEFLEHRLDLLRLCLAHARQGGPTTPTELR